MREPIEEPLATLPPAGTDERRRLGCTGAVGSHLPLFTRQSGSIPEERPEGPGAPTAILIGLAISAVLWAGIVMAVWRLLRG